MIFVDRFRAVVTISQNSLSLSVNGEANSICEVHGNGNQDL